MTATADREEIAKFSKLSHEWWDEKGAFAPLHRINPLRIAYIKQHIERQFGSMQVSVIDIGCGGGLVSEAMAKLGANVTGVDASEENISAAKLHAKQSGLDIDYRCALAENIQEQFDVVLALEIVEHVADAGAFVEAACKLAKPGGLIVFSTLNRTMKSLALGVIAAEYVLRWVPRGTHDWQKFLKPSELAHEFRKHDVGITDMSGLVLNPLNWKWELSACDLGVNYFMTGKKA